MTTPTVHASVQIPAAPTAPIVADFTEHALRVAYVARADVERLAKDEWAAAGVYVLIDGDGGSRMYVGKSTALRDRVLTHRRGNTQVPGWTRAILVKRDTSHGFTSADIGFLEGRLAAELDAVPGIVLVQGKMDEDLTLPPAATVPLNALVSSILASLRLAGVSLHRTDIETPTASATTRTAIHGSVADLIAEGLLQSGADLHCSRHGTTGHGVVGPDGRIIVDGVGYVSPSLAAGKSLGSDTSSGFGGWDMWRVGSLTGPSLSKLRAQLPARTDE